MGIACVLSGLPLNYGYWAHFLYIQNLPQSYLSTINFPPGLYLRHLWSMGVEEQFYLAWPLVVWICPNRRVLLRVTLALIGASFVLRFLSPLLNLQPWFLGFWTPTRVDAILLGAVLAILRGDPLLERLERIGKYVALGGVCVLALFVITTGYAETDSYWRAVFLIPLCNVAAAGIVLGAMEQNSILCRLCSGKGICWLGARSYALYLFHYTYIFWFVGPVRSFVERFAPHHLAAIISGAAALGLSVLLAALSYRIIEQPAMNMKKRLKYGPVKTPIPSVAGG